MLKTALIFANDRQGRLSHSKTGLLACRALINAAFLYCFLALGASQAQITLTVDPKDSTGATVGRVVVLNGDDDNNNAIEDYKESPVPAESSLRLLTISWKVNGVMVFLRKGENGAKIKVWKDREKRTEITFNGTDNKFNVSPQGVFIEGISPSEKMNDVELFGSFKNNDDKRGTVRLTVLWVDQWQFKFKDTEEWDASFKPTLDPRQQVVDPANKPNFTGLHIYKDKRVGQGIQLKGRVKPSDFTERIIIHRAASLCEFRTLNGITRTSNKPFMTLNNLTRNIPVAGVGGDDDTLLEAHQQDPQANGAGGFTYDWDNPGVSGNEPNGTVDRARWNFVQWPRFGGKRAGILAYWSQAISRVAEADPPQVTLDKIPAENAYNAKGDNGDLKAAMDLSGLRTNMSATLEGDSCNPLLITSPGPIEPLANGKVGVFYIQKFETRGGIPPTKWTITAGALPDGLTLNAATGTVSGTPTKAGTFNFTLQLQDSQNPGGSKSARPRVESVVIAAADKAPQQRQTVSLLTAVDVDRNLSRLVDDLAEAQNSEHDNVRIDALNRIVALAERRSQAPQAFAAAEEKLVHSLRGTIRSPEDKDRRRAYDLIQALGSLQSASSIPLLLDNLGFRNPHVFIYTRGPVTYTEPEPKDLPAFVALISIGDSALQPACERALAEDDTLKHAACAELVFSAHGPGGGLNVFERWASNEEPGSARRLHAESMRDRLRERSRATDVAP